jgi:hypothetical protein
MKRLDFFSLYLSKEASSTTFVVLICICYTQYANCSVQTRDRKNWIAKNVETWDDSCNPL